MAQVTGDKRAVLREHARGDGLRGPALGGAAWLSPRTGATRIHTRGPPLERSAASRGTALVGRGAAQGPALAARATSPVGAAGAPTPAPDGPPGAPDDLARRRLGRVPRRHRGDLLRWRSGRGARRWTSSGPGPAGGRWSCWSPRVPSRLPRMASAGAGLCPSPTWRSCSSPLGCSGSGRRSPSAGCEEPEGDVHVHVQACVDCGRGHRRRARRRPRLVRGLPGRGDPRRGRGRDAEPTPAASHAPRGRRRPINSEPRARRHDRRRRAPRPGRSRREVGPAPRRRRVARLPAPPAAATATGPGSGRCAGRGWHASHRPRRPPGGEGGGAHPPGASRPASGSAAPVAACARLRSASARLQRLDEPTGDGPSILRRAEYLTAVSGGSVHGVGPGHRRVERDLAGVRRRARRTPDRAPATTRPRATGPACPRSPRARRRRAGSGATRPTSPATPAR